LRVIDVFPAFYAVGGVCCVLSPKYQRLGDIAANTVVIYTASEKIPDLELLFTGSYNSLRNHAHLAARSPAGYQAACRGNSPPEKSPRLINKKPLPTWPKVVKFETGPIRPPQTSQPSPPHSAHTSAASAFTTIRVRGWEFQRSDLDAQLEALILGEEVGKVFLDGWTSIEHAPGQIDIIAV
jgi:hypothetical protein